MSDQINYPTIHDFPNSYKGNGMKAFEMIFTYENETPLDFTGAIVKMQLHSQEGRKLWEFSSDQTGDNRLTLPGNGVVEFPEIKSWNIPSGKHFYDLTITDTSGFVKTFIKGTWTINQNITR